MYRYKVGSDMSSLSERGKLAKSSLFPLRLAVSYVGPMIGIAVYMLNKSIVGQSIS
jgi:hypothetical protein